MEQTHSLLAEAAQTGNTEVFYSLLRLNPYLLDDIDKIPFVDTPLHTSASAGSTHFALEILTLKPSFGKKLNPDGFSPLDLALRYQHTNTVKRLVDYDPHLIGVKGKERYTALHYVAEVDDVDLLAMFLDKSPKSVEDLTVRGETAVHVAVRNRNVGALKVLLGFLKLTDNERILNWEDENGDTVLQIAASTDNIEVVKLLIGKASINHKNRAGLTALDIVVGLHSNTAATGKIKRILHAAAARRSSTLPKIDSLADIFSSKVSQKRGVVNFDRLHNLSSETRNTVLVVAVLITTTTYQAILTPPGGDSSIDPIIIIINTIPFITSIGVICLLLPRTIYNLFLVVPLFSLALSYGISAAVQFALPYYSIVLIFFCVSGLTLRCIRGSFKCLK